MLEVGLLEMEKNDGRLNRHLFASVTFDFF